MDTGTSVPKMSANRVLTALATLAGLALVGIGVLGWTAPAQAVVTTPYAIDCPGPIIQYGSNFLVACGNRHKVKLVSQSGSVLVTLTYDSNMDPNGVAVTSNGDIWATSDNGRLARWRGGVATYYTIFDPTANNNVQEFRKIVTDGTYLYALGVVSEGTPIRYPEKIYKIDSNGQLIAKVEEGWLTGSNCISPNSQWARFDTVKDLEFESSLYSEPVIWSVFDQRLECYQTGEIHNHVTWRAVRASDLSPLTSCLSDGGYDASLPVNRRIPETARLNSWVLDVMVKHVAGQVRYVKRFNAKTCAQLTYADADSGTSYKAAIASPANLFTFFAGNNTDVSIYRWTGATLQTMNNDTGHIDPMDITRVGNVFWTPLVGGILMKYDFSTEGNLTITSGPSANPIHARNATINWTTNQATDAFIQYGTTTSYGTTKGPTDTFPPGSTSHAVYIGAEIAAGGLLPDTTYHYKVTSCNGYTCVSSGDLTFRTAILQPPQININDPTNGKTIGQGNYRVRGVAGDVDGTVSLVQVRACPGTCGSQAWVNATNDGTNFDSWSINWNFSSLGSWQLQAKARDNDGLETTQTYTITVGAVPVVTITSHADGATVPDANITLGGDATDADNFITAMRVIVNGGAPQPIIINPGQTVNDWSKAITLQSGGNTVKVEAADATGLIGSKTININLGNPPIITIDSHSDGQHVTSASIALAGTVNDADNNITSPIRVSVNGTMQPFSYSPLGQHVDWTQTRTLTPGPNLIHVEATDVTSLIGMKDITVIYDAPYYTFTLSSASPVTVPQGTPAQYAFRLTGFNNWSTPVLLSLSQCAGIPCAGPSSKFAWTRTTVTPDADGEDVTLNVTTAGIAAGTYNLQAKAEKQGGGDVKLQDFVLIVSDGPNFMFQPSISVKTIFPGGSAAYSLHLQQTIPTYSYDVALTRDTITPPAGGSASMITDASFSPSTIRPSPPGPGAGNGSVTFTTAPDITPGTWTIKVKGTGNDPNVRVQYFTASLIVSQPDFTIDAYKQGDPSTKTVTVQQGTDAIWDVKLDSVNGWGGDIDLSSPTHPVEINGRVSFIPPKTGVAEHGLVTLPASGSTSGQFIISTTGLAAGTYVNIKVRGKWDGGATPWHDVSPALTLIVTDGPDYDFTPPPDPVTQPGTLGGAVSYTLNLKETVPEYASPVDLTLDSIAPAGGIGKLTVAGQPPALPIAMPPAITPADKDAAPATRQVTINIAADTPQETYTLTFKGVGTDPMTRTHFVTVQLVLETVDYLLTATPATQTGTIPGTATYTLNLKDVPADSDLDYTWPVDLMFVNTTPASSIVPANLPVARDVSEGAGTNYAANFTIPAGTAPALYTIKLKGYGNDPSHIVHEVTVQLDLGSVDVTPPTIPASSIVCTPGPDRITVVWTTNEAATGKLYYAKTTPPGTVQDETGGLKTSHSVLATGLTPSTDYYYQVESCDAAGNCTPKTPSPAAVCRTTAVSDGELPVVVWVSPTDGSTVSGTIDLKASATDNVAIAEVRFSVDGAPLSTDTAPPGCSPDYCKTGWNTTTVSNGNHSLIATAKDTAGNTASDTITVTVNNGSAAPVCSGLVFFPSGTGADITWHTDINSDSRVYYCREGGSAGTCGHCSGGYGPGQYYCEHEEKAEAVVDHFIQLDGLSSGVLYHFMAESCVGDSCGQCR